MVREGRKVPRSLVLALVALAAGCGGEARSAELERLLQAATHARSLGLRVNAGHGLDYDNVGPVAALPHLEELNIGHSIVARALTSGVTAAVAEMLALIAPGGS